jgi:hypothetical protein
MPGDSCTAHIRFTPQDAGPKVARLAFFGEAEGGTMVALRGEGVAPAVTLAPSGFDFGAEALGTKGAPHYFAVRNGGDTAVDLSSVAVVGTDLDQFALAGDDCTGAVLGAGQECLVRVRFAPDSAGAKAATLRIGSDAGPFTASLSGQGAGAYVARPAGPRAWHRRKRRFRRGRAISSVPHRPAIGDRFAWRRG